MFKTYNLYSFTNRLAQRNSIMCTQLIIFTHNAFIIEKKITKN